MNTLQSASVTQLLDHILVTGRFELGYAAAVRDSCLTVSLSGPDTPLLLARDAELLQALEQVSNAALRAEDDTHVCFTAGGYHAGCDGDKAA